MSATHLNVSLAEDEQPISRTYQYRKVNYTHFSVFQKTNRFGSSAQLVASLPLFQTETNVDIFSSGYEADA